MVSKGKLYIQLDALESELKENLIPLLKQAAEGNNELMFCVSGFNTLPELKSRTNKKTEALVSIGSQILTLRGKLNEPSDGTIAERICWYCQKWSDLGNNQRKSAQGLAQEFLEEIENENSKT